MAVHAPFYERFVADEEDLRYHALGGKMQQTLISAAGSFKLHDRFIFGVGLSLGFTALSLEFARDTALDGGSAGIASDCGGSPCGYENIEATERYAIDVSTDGIGGLFAAKSLALSLGVAIEVQRDWWLGVSYVSPPGAIPSATFDLDLSGTVDVAGAPRDGANARSGEAEITFRMPQSAFAGIRGPILPGYDLVADLRWQNYSRQQLFDIQMFGGDLADGDVPTWSPRLRGFRDVYRLSGGIERQSDARLRYGGRLRFETGAVDASTITPLQVDGYNLTVAGGAELRVSQQLVVALGYDLSWFPTVDSGAENVFDPQSRVDCVDTQFDLDACASARKGSALPTAAGRYGRIQHALSLSLRYDSL
jgi:long-subunit fatty acid transport protein